MAERKKSKFEEELAKLLTTPQLPDDPLTQRILEYPKTDSFGNVGDVYPDRNNPFVDDNNRYTFVGDNVSPGNGHEERRPGIWPVVAKEGEPAYNDPGLILRSAAITGKNRQERNKEAAKGQFFRDIENIRNALNPETHEREMRGVPAGHRAGLMNLNRPQYVAAMEESATAPGIVLKEHAAEANANSPEAEYNRNETFAAAVDKKLKGLKIRRDRLQERLDTLKEIRKLDIAGDQMWNIAKLDYLNNGDRTGLENIMGRIKAELQRRDQAAEAERTRTFQSEENEKNRQSNIDIAKMNKDSQKQDKIDAAKRSASRHRAWMTQLIDQYKTVPSTANRLNIVREYLDLQDAADEAGYNSIEEFIGSDDYAIISEALGMSKSADDSNTKYDNKQEWINAYERAKREASRNGNYEPLKKLLTNAGNLLSKDEASKINGEIQSLEDDWKAKAPAREVEGIQRQANAIIDDYKHDKIDRDKAAEDLRKLRQAGKIDVSFDLGVKDKASATVTRIKGKK